MDILFKLRHKQSGLFFNPAYWQNKLDEKGRIYLKKPSLAKIGNVIRVSNTVAEKYNLKTVDTLSGYKGLEIVSDEWEVCEFAVILNQTFDCPQPKKKEVVDEEWSNVVTSTPITAIQSIIDTMKAPDSYSANAFDTLTVEKWLAISNESEKVLDW